MVTVTTYPGFCRQSLFIPANPASILVTPPFPPRNIQIWPVDHMVTLLTVQRKILQFSPNGSDTTFPPKT